MLHTVAGLTPQQFGIILSLIVLTACARQLAGRPLRAAIRELARWRAAAVARGAAGLPGRRRANPPVPVMIALGNEGERVNIKRWLTPFLVELIAAYGAPPEPFTLVLLTEKHLVDERGVAHQVRGCVERFPLRGGDGAGAGRRTVMSVALTLGDAIPGDNTLRSILLHLWPAAIGEVEADTWSLPPVPRGTAPTASGHSQQTPPRDGHPAGVTATTAAGAPVAGLGSPPAGSTPTGVLVPAPLNSASRDGGPDATPELTVPAHLGHPLPPRPGVSAASANGH